MIVYLTIYNYHFAMSTKFTPQRLLTLCLFLMMGWWQGSLAVAQETLSVIALDTKSISFSDFSNIGSSYTTAIQGPFAASDGNSYSGWTKTSISYVSGKKNVFQAKKNEGTLTSPTITSKNGFTVTITYSAAKAPTLQIGSEAAVTGSTVSTASNDGTGLTMSATTTSTSATFTIKAGSGVLYVSKIEIIPTPASSAATAPTFTPAAGSYNGSATISLTAPDGYTGGLLYTLDGDDPTTSDAAKEYTEAFKLTTSTTVKAVALDSEGNASDVATADYVITYNAPTMDLPGGTYPGNKTISLSVKDLGDGIIVYTTDGSDPLTNPNGTATFYTDPIPVTTGTTTIKAYTRYNGGNSAVTEATYVIADPLTHPLVFAAADGAFYEVPNGGYASATGNQTFVDNYGKSHTFNLTQTYRNSGLQMQKGAGKIESPVYEYPYGYVVSVTTSQGTVSISSGTYATEAASASASLEIPEASASFTINASADNTPIISTITITPKTSSKKKTTLSFAEEAINLGRVHSFTGQKATLTSQGTELTGKTIGYTSSDEAVATVDQEGTVALSSYGTTTITATFAGDEDYESATASYTLTYSDTKTATTLSFPQAAYSVIKGETFTAPTPTLTANDTALEGKPFSYESSNTAVATVNADGTVTLVDIGETTITATFAGDEDYESSTASYTLTYVNMQEVGFDFSQPLLYGVDAPADGKETDLTEGQSISSGMVSLTSVTNGSTSTRFWNSAGTITLRAYKGAELSLSVPAGYVMSQVVVNTEKNAAARDYTLGTKSCTASKSFTWTGEEQQLRLAVSSSASDNPRFTSMTVTVVRKADFIVGDTEDLTAVLPEVSTPDRTIVLNRKVYAGWNTYCVPFSLTQAQLEEAYGAGAVAKAFKGVMVNGDNTSITFEEETEGGIVANKPYMLKVANDVTAPQMFTGITLEPATDCETTIVKDGETYTFKGILTPTSLTTDGSQYFLNNAGTSFVLPANSTSKLKATRAYFILPTGSGQAQSFSFRFENGNLTGISEASTDSRHNGSWYTIEGRRIAQPTEKGIYIHGNRKVVVK